MIQLLRHSPLHSTTAPLPCLSAQRPRRTLCHPLAGQHVPLLRYGTAQSLSLLTSWERQPPAAMASVGANQPSTAAQSSPQQTAAGSRTENPQEELSSSPVEMRTLPSSGVASAATSNTAQPSPSVPTGLSEIAVPHTSETIPAHSQIAATPAAQPAPPAPLNRAETEAIGPSTDTPAAVPDSSDGPVLVIMLLLPSTGARHPYKIDGRYLKKRNVTVDDMDPYNINVYTLKELIWRDWREGKFSLSFNWRRGMALRRPLPYRMSVERCTVLVASTAA
jgi:hypothetical protein